MIAVSVDFKDKFAVNKFRRIPVEMTKQNRKVMDAVKDMLRQDLIMNSPEGATGRLRAGWNLRLQKIGSGHALVITNKMFYFPYIHEGTKPHLIRVPIGSSSLGGGSILSSKIFMHPGISHTPKPGNKGVNPFVTRILRVRQEKIYEAFTKGYTDLINSGKASDLPPIPYFTLSTRGDKKYMKPNSYVYTNVHKFRYHSRLEQNKRHLREALSSI